MFSRRVLAQSLKRQLRLSRLLQLSYRNTRAISTRSPLLNQHQEEESKQRKLIDNEKEYKPHPTEGFPRESEGTMNKRLEMIERVKAVILGLLALGGIVGTYELYQNKAKIKYYLFHEQDLSGFEKSYEDIAEKLKRAKARVLAFVPTNPNSSAVVGLYVVGNNDNRQLINDNIKIVTHFMRNSWFDDKLIKDVNIGEKSSCAIDSKGNLIQWGNGYKRNSDPEYSLKGQNLTSVKMSNGVIYCLNKKGELIYLPEDSKKQESFVTNKKLLGLRTEHFARLSNKVKFDKIETGDEHLLLLSSDHKIYVMATGLTKLEKSYGQFGLPMYSQFDSPPEPNQLIELTNLNYYADSKDPTHIRKRNFTSIASGDYHNLVLDEFGNVWSWGVNTFGSLGHVINYNTEIIAIPKKLEMNNSYFKRNELPNCTNISAGGYSSFGTFQSSNIYDIFEDYIKNNDMDVSQFEIPKSLENLLHLGWGKCLNGQLGIGHYVHCQSDPIKVKNLMNLTNFNEETQKLQAINVKDWSIGNKHSIVTLDNNDVLTFGDNEFYQLGNGKRIKSSTPSNIPKLVEPNSTTEGGDNTNDVRDNKDDSNKNLKEKKYQEVNNRLQLNSVEFTHSNGKTLKNVEQKIYAGHDASAIYYSPK